MSHYQTAIGLLGPDDGRYGNLLLALGEVALLAGKEEQAEVAYKMAQQWLEQRRDDETAAVAAHGLGLACWRQEKRTEAYAALKHALELLGEHQSTKAVEVLLDVSVLLTVFMSQQDEGTAYAQQAWEMARDLGDTRLETMAHRIVIGNLTIQSSELLSALPPLEQALTLAENRGDLPEAGECCLYLACVYYWVAKIRRSYEVSERRIELIKQCRQSYQLRTAYTWHALLLASQGGWAKAEKMLELAYPIVDHLTSPLPFAFLHQIRGFLAYQREDYVIAERELQTALVDQGQRMSLGEIPFYFGLLGLAQVAIEKREEAYSYMVRLERLLDTLPSGIPSTGPVLVCLALTALALRDEERAKHLYSRLLAFRSQFYWFLVDRILGLLAILQGEWETAATHLAEAEETARREGLKPELARILLGFANVESGRGGQGSSIRAKKRLNQAIECFEELDMATSALNARSQLHSLAGRPPDSKPSPLLASLTEHEVKVLRLLVDGKSNREIAKELHLAQRTIENQLTEIFSKTDSKNRAAAAAFAERHGLVYPVGLTQQEVEVLKLLVDDKSNREIAQALHLAYKTIDDLLVTIFLKTKSGNRAEAKAFATHHGLT